MTESERVRQLQDSMASMCAKQDLAPAVIADPQRLIDALCTAEVLHMSPNGRWYEVITPKRVVRAGYRKGGELWTATDDQVEWEDPPDKIHVRLWWDRGNVAWSCTCVAGTFDPPDRVLREVARHTDRYHPDADVTVDPLPDPPHAHSWIWNMSTSGTPIRPRQAVALRCRHTEPCWER